MDLRPCSDVVKTFACITSSCLAAPPLNLRDEVPDALLQRKRACIDQGFDQALVPELLPIWIHRLGNTIGVEAQPLTRAQRDGALSDRP